jgi:hypothetical protein
MRPAPSLCPHLDALAPGDAPFTIAPEEILDFWQGPVEAVARCGSCGACAWLELLDAEPVGGIRIFALAPIREADVALYLRDRARGSCDVGRSRAELEALAAAAGPVAWLVALAPEERRMVAAVRVGPDLVLPRGAWPGRMPAPEDGCWFARLGLTKPQRAAC